MDGSLILNPGTGLYSLFVIVQILATILIRLNTEICLFAKVCYYYY